MRDFVQGATRFGLVLLVPGCTLVVIDAEGIMVLLFSETYRPGGDILRYQAIAFGAVAFFDILFHALMAAGALWQSAAIVVGLIPVVVTMSWILMGTMGAAGAALALAITMVAATLIASILTFRRFGTLVRPATVLRVAAATAIIGLISAYVSVVGIWLVLKLAVLLAAYLILLVLFREIGGDDLKPFAVWAR